MFSPTAKRKIFFTISAVLVVISIILLFVRGLNYGIDFTGGNTMQFDLGKTKFSESVEAQIRDIVKEKANTNDITIQKVGETGISVKTIELTNEQSDAIIDTVKKAFNLEQSAVLANEKVSGTVSARLIGDAFKALLLAIVLMLVYITIRFDFQSGSCAVLALAHDVIIMLGFFSLFSFTVNTGFIAAVLTIVGYSINATIIVFDRVRENQRIMKKATYNEIADSAIKGSVFRAINSSITTLLTIGVLYIVGVESIKEFALPIIVGIVAGTYSSLFIAGPFWAMWKGSDKKKA